MTLRMDPETAAALAAALAERPDAPLPGVGDVAGRRAASDASFPALLARLPETPGVTRTDHTLTTADGAELLLRWYAPPGGGPGSAALHIHGGGMIMGSVDRNDAGTAFLVGQSGVPMLSVDYRLAPEHPDPVPVEDCYAALVWLPAHAGGLRGGPGPARGHR